MAQIDPDPNGIGLFFDSQYTIRCGSSILMTQLPVYLVASNIETAGGLGGWEAMVTMEGAGLMFLSGTMAGMGPINLYAAPEFQVGLGVPMEYAPNLLLATLTYFVTAVAPASFRIHPIAHAQSIANECCFADGADVGNLVAFQAPQGSWLLPAALLNQPCDTIVGAENETWGGVKGMFK